MPRIKGESRDKGDHLERRKVKTAIIELILSDNEAVPEPEIREFLRKKYNIVDQGNIKKHLKDLQGPSYSCIEKIPPKKNGYANEWDIKKIENLNKIKKHFSEIGLKKYDKSRTIVLKRYRSNCSPSVINMLRIQLLLSTSVFNFCLETDNIKTLYDKAQEIYRVGEGFDQDQHLNTYINEVYTECIKRISKAPNFWLSVLNEHIDDLLRSEVNQNSLKEFPNFEISEKTFRKMLEEVFFPLEGQSARECCLRIMKEMAVKMSEEIFQAELKGTYIEFMGSAEEIIKTTMSEEMLKRLVEGDPKEMYYKIIIIKMYQCVIRLSSPDIIFEHCVQRDIADGTASPEEVEFLCRIKEDRAKFTAEMNKERMSSSEFSDNFYDEYFEKIKTWPIFSYINSNEFCIEYYEKCRKKMAIL